MVSFVQSASLGLLLDVNSSNWSSLPCDEKVLKSMFFELVFVPIALLNHCISVAAQLACVLLWLLLSVLVPALPPVGACLSSFAALLFWVFLFRYTPPPRIS